MHIFPSNETIHHCVLSFASATATTAAFIFIFNLFCVDLLKMFCTKACATGKASGFAANYKDFVPTRWRSRMFSVCVRVYVCVLHFEGFSWLATDVSAHTLYAFGEHVGFLCSSVRWMSWWSRGKRWKMMWGLSRMANIIKHQTYFAS